MKASDPIREHVMVRLQVSSGRPDIHPVSAWWNVREKRLTLFQQIGEQVVLERIVLAFRNQVEDLWLEHISAGIDIPAISFAGLRLLDKTLDAAVASVSHTVHAGIFDRNQKIDGGRVSLLCWRIIVFKSRSVSTSPLKTTSARE
jgi:hypothetical protein